MTVEELIKRLQALPEEAEVRLEIRTEHPTFNSKVEDLMYLPGEDLKCPHKGCLHSHVGVGLVTLLGSCSL